MPSLRQILLVPTLLALLANTPALAQAAAPPPATDLANGVAAYRGGDYVKAEKLLRPLAEKGNPTAQYWMGQGCAYWRWPGSKQSGCSFQWYSKAAAQGDVESQSELGQLYRTGSTEPLNAPLAKNVAEGVARLTWAAERGSASAQLRLIDYYGIDIAADRHVKDTDQQRSAYYWSLVAADTLKAHPEATADPLVAQSASSLAMRTAGYRAQITEGSANLEDFLADTFSPKPERQYPEVKPAAPTPATSDFSKRVFELSNDFDYFAKTAPAATPAPAPDKTK